MKVAFHTLGCKVNQYETEAIRERFLDAGYEEVADSDAADVYVVNTCTVTSLADRKSRQFIRRANKLNPEAVIAVTGCYAEMDPEEVEKIEGVDIVTGTGSKGRVFEEADKLARARSGGCGRPSFIEVKQYEDLTEYEDLGSIKGMEGRTRAFIKIQEGCDRFCSYCIIPKARGKIRSRAKADIAREVKGLIGRGYKEIVLTGINTALYGKDLGYDGIAPLIEELENIEGDFRIRLSSLEPTVIDADYAVGLLRFEKLCHHLHLSLQSGSDSVLRAMNRRYTGAEYLEIAERLREADPYYGISADVIVGFPGESEEDFNDSMKIIKESCLCRTHIFKYSKRKGTPAATMDGQIPDGIKNERSKRLREVADEVKLSFIKGLYGIVRTALLERVEDGFVTGYTDNYVKVYLETDDTKGYIDSFRDVRIGEPFRDGARAVLT